MNECINCIYIQAGVVYFDTLKLMRLAEMHPSLVRNSPSKANSFVKKLLQVILSISDSTFVYTVHCKYNVYCTYNVRCTYNVSCTYNVYCTYNVHYTYICTLFH